MFSEKNAIAIILKMLYDSNVRIDILYFVLRLNPPVSAVHIKPFGGCKS